MDDEKIEDDIKAEEQDTPLEVIIKKDVPPPQPSFDYDDYSPTDEEILDIEKEIQEKITKRSKNG